MARVALRPWIEQAFETRHGEPMRNWVMRRRAANRSWRQIADELYVLTDHVEGRSRLTGAALSNWYG